MFKFIVNIAPDDGLIMVRARTPASKVVMKFNIKAELTFAFLNVKMAVYWFHDATQTHWQRLNGRYPRK